MEAIAEGRYRDACEITHPALWLSFGALPNLCPDILKATFPPKTRLTWEIRGAGTYPTDRAAVIVLITADGEEGGWVLQFVLDKPVTISPNGEMKQGKYKRWLIYGVQS